MGKQNETAASEVERRSRGLRAALFVIAGLCLVGGVWRAVAIDGPPDKDVLFFFLSAVAALLAESITKFKFAGLEFEREVKDLTERVEEIADVTLAPAVGVRDTTRPSPGRAERAMTEGREPGAGSTLEDLVAARVRLVYKDDLAWEDDPVAEGQEHEPSKDGNELSADIAPSRNSLKAVRVDLHCRLSSDLRKADDTRVAFFLHHTFPNSVRYVDAESGQASVSLLAYGSFTAGALLSDGTWLTYDLTRADLGALDKRRRHYFMTH